MFFSNLFQSVLYRRTLIVETHSRASLRGQFLFRVFVWVYAFRIETHGRASLPYPRFNNSSRTALLYDWPIGTSTFPITMILP